MATILIVDDNLTGRSLLSWSLQAHGYNTLEAGDGIEALSLARKDRPDLVISDALMPRMDGFSLCRQWMADRDLARIPFIFYSASYPSDIDREFGLSIGARGYFTKPMPIDQLIAEAEAQLVEDAGENRLAVESEDEIENAHREIVTRKLEAKIAELKDLNTAYKRQSEEYARLFRANPQPMWIYDPSTLRFLAVNDAAVAVYGYSHGEWMEMTIHDIRPGEDKDRLHAQLTTEADIAFSDADVWTHVKKDGSAIQVEVSAHSLEYEGRPARVVTALDVTERVKTQAREQAHLKSIEEAMQGTIAVVTRMVELRDPYTAGHQRRTAALCAAIGRELGLPAGQVDGLTMAALIHDIGKISIPTDLLTKPGRISALELSYIQQHAELGYELLQKVPFPWPIANIVRQHHERMDGSGYPQGLQGDEILLEARILAVADTIEAMASHRPYRPACPIDQALEQVESNAGSLFDSAVAAACLRLFREQGYTLPTG